MSRSQDDEILEKLLIAGSPTAKAAALTLLDERTGGKITEILRRILRKIGKENLLRIFRLHRTSWKFWIKLES